MKVTLKKAVKLMTAHLGEKSPYRLFLLQALRDTENEKLVLREGEVVEIQYDEITICFSWENISAFNNITSNYCDVMSHVRDVFACFGRL